MRTEVFKMPLNLAEDHIKSNEIMLFNYNHSFEEVSFFSGLSEKFLEQKISELEEMGSSSKGLYCLAFAKLTELTLLCAGNYADAFELTAAGDLLVNPRIILVHIRNRIKPVVKKRHSRLTDQFRNVASTRGGVVRWLKNETFLEIKKEPLLPYLYESLKRSGCMSQEYLRSIERRMKKIADVTVFLCSLHLPNGQDFHQWLQQKTKSERQFIESRLCNFDTRTFYDLGHDFHQIIQGQGYKSKFLS
jgi:hypothetical protein